MKIPNIPAMSALRVSAVLTLVGLALMVWSIVKPTALPVMLAMTVGQGIGCMAFGLYLCVVIRDLRRAPGELSADVPEPPEPRELPEGSGTP